MATKLQKAIRFTLLWMLVPATMAAIGYYVIGPRLGSHEPPVAEPRDDIQDEGEPAPTKSTRNYQPPAVEVSVKRGQTIRDRDMVIRRSKPKPKPKPEEAPSAEAPKPPIVSPPTDGAETVPVGDGQP